jgi:5-methylcytosine-specific restriction endonuclease McrA
LVTPDQLLRRKTITSSRSALNGYQKGECFYCARPIVLEDGSFFGVDVDHFFPHLLKSELRGLNLDGVWNLVLACGECNKGTGGKGARVPDVSLVKRLHHRNDWLINSHHPLRGTINSPDWIERT